MPSPVIGFATALFATFLAQAPAPEAPASPPSGGPPPAPTEAPGALTRPPELVDFVPAAYPPEAEAAGAAGAVVFSIVIGEDGSLKNRHVISPVSPACDALALEALSTYRFRAARDEQGRPVEGRFGLSIRF